MQELIQEGLSNLCRLCGEDDKECFDLFDKDRQEEELLAKIEQAIRIAITQEDGLPTGICTLCHDKLTGYATFYQQCHDTQDRLQEFLSIESAMQKSSQCNEEREPSNEDEYVYEGDPEEVYYYEEAPDEGLEDMETVDADGSFVMTENDEDIAEESSMPVSQRKKMLPLGDLSPEQKEDSIQTCTEHLSLKKQCLTESNSQVVLSSIIDNAKLDSISITSSKEKTNQRTTDMKVTSALVLKPPPLVKISAKTGPPLVHIVKNTSQSAPPLVPILRCSQAEGSLRTSNPLPTPSLVPISKTATEPLLNFKAAKSNLSSSVPMAVLQTEKAIFKARPINPHFQRISESVYQSIVSKKTCKELGSPIHSNQQLKVDKRKSDVPSRPKDTGRAFLMADDKSAAVEVDIPNKQQVQVIKRMSDVSSSSKGSGRAFIMTDDKTVAVEVDIQDNPKTQQMISLMNELMPILKGEPMPLLKGEPIPTVIKKNNSKKGNQTVPNLNRKGNCEPVAFIKLRNGDFIPLADVEKIPLEDIPVPPVILMSYAEPDKNLPELSVRESLSFSEFSSSATVKLSSGLFVSDCLSDLPAVEVTPHPSFGREMITKTFVLANKTSEPRKKKKIVVVRSRPAASIRVGCPEAAIQVEDISTDLPLFRCKMCGVTVTNRKRCEYHIISKHLTEKCAFECKECGQKFATNYLRTQHIKNRHTPKPDYFCGVCGEKFRTPSVLKGHELRHTAQEPPFKCDVCGKGFYTKANCTKHYLDVHTEKTAICDICGQCFAGEGRLKEHRKNHIGGFACEECGKTYNSKSRLRAHRQVHKASELMHCKCGKMFATFAFLHNHSKVCPERVRNVRLSSQSLQSISRAS